MLNGLFNISGELSIFEFELTSSDQPLFGRLSITTGNYKPAGWRTTNLPIQRPKKDESNERNGCGNTDYNAR